MTEYNSTETSVKHSSALAHPGEPITLVLDPEPPMHDPVLFTSVNPRDAAITVERIEHGDVLVLAGHFPIAEYKLGRPLHLVASREQPVKIHLSNQDMRQARVGASLVTGTVNPEKET